MLSNQQDGRAKTGDFWFQKKCPKRKVVWNVGKLSPVDTLFIVHLDYLCFGQHSNLTISNDTGPLRNIICKQKWISENKDQIFLIDCWMIIPPSAITPMGWNQLECYPVSPIPIATLPWSQKMPGSIGKGGHSCDRIATGARNPQTAKTKNVQSAGFFSGVFFFFGGGMNVSALVVGSCLVKGFSWKTRWSVQPNVNVVGGGSSLSRKNTIP